MSRTHGDDIPYDRRKTCVWTRELFDPFYIYNPTCDEGRGKNADHSQPKGEYCPYCGGRIELEEQ